MGGFDLILIYGFSFVAFTFIFGQIFIQVATRCFFPPSTVSLPTPKLTRTVAIVEKSLVTKEALSHEEACGLSESMSEEEMYTSNAYQNSNETGAREVANADIENFQNASLDAAIIENELTASIQCRGNDACFICLESFEVKDEVSWSENEECEHVFHHQCILRWLRKHDECPCCRRNYLPNLDPSDTSKEKDGTHETPLDTIVRRQANYCVKHGLVKDKIGSREMGSRGVIPNTTQPQSDVFGCVLSDHDKIEFSMQNEDTKDNYADVELGSL